MKMQQDAFTPVDTAIAKTRPADPTGDFDYGAEIPTNAGFMDIPSDAAFSNDGFTPVDTSIAKTRPTADFDIGARIPTNAAFQDDSFIPVDTVTATVTEAEEAA
jgi:hypothetical protein